VAHRAALLLAGVVEIRNVVDLSVRADDPLGLPCEEDSSVTHVPGINCYPSLRKESASGD
jgi:hypothetical protein